jgi:hypothetical protein
MGLETGSTISSFITSNPTSSDPVNQGDDHIRLIKSVLQAQFPGSTSTGFNTAITATEAELNSLHNSGIGNLVANVHADGSGNVGIGTASPAQKLHVVGNSYVSGTTLLADAGFMFNSDAGQDTGISWASDGVMNVRCNGATVGQFNSTGFTGNSATANSATNAVNATTSATCTGNSATATYAPLISGTAQTASGATVSFTGIPSWAKRITVLLVGVTTVSSGIPAIRAGAGSYEATGYLGATVKVGSVNTTDGGASATTSWDIVNSASSTYIYTGQLVITKFSGNQYIISGLLQYNTSTGLIVNGVKTFSGDISQLQLRMSTGADTFNGGTMNIMWE